MRRRRRQILVAVPALLVVTVALLTGFAFGCFAGPRRPTVIKAAADDAPRLIHVTGWNGAVAGDRDFLEALRAGGCPHAMETFDWTDGHNGLSALWYAQRSSKPAARLAARVTALAREAPARPIDLTADSSGCGVALSALGQLPPDVRVRRVVLSSPAVSPDFDLAPALAAVAERVIVFESDRDWFILGLGTTIFGTVDGKHGSGAGRLGFAAIDDPTLATKLDARKYDPAWQAAYGHRGRHAQALQPQFARGYIAPLLTR